MRKSEITTKRTGNERQLTKIVISFPVYFFQIMLSGRNIFMGYLNKPDKTAETIDGKIGWMRTGDIGKLDQHGFLWITGRIKGKCGFL